LAHDHVDAEESQAEDLAAAEGDVAKLRVHLERLAELVLVRPRRPHPAHPENAVADAIQLAVGAVGRVVTLREEKPFLSVRSGQLVRRTDHADAPSLRAAIRFHYQCAPFEE